MLSSILLYQIGTFCFLIDIRTYLKMVIFHERVAEPKRWVDNHSLRNEVRAHVDSYLRKIDPNSIVVIIRSVGMVLCAGPAAWAEPPQWTRRMPAPTRCRRLPTLPTIAYHTTVQYRYWLL